MGNKTETDSAGLSAETIKDISNMMSDFDELKEVVHVGVNANRIRRERKERAFAEEWTEQGPRTLGYILFGNDRYKHAVSDRDAEVAASVIQWLGSQVGQAFLRDVQERYEKICRQEVE